MSRRFQLDNLVVEKNISFNKLKVDLEKSLSNVESDFLKTYIPSTASLYDKSRFIVYCILGIIDDELINAINNGEVFYKGISIKDKKWLGKYCKDRPDNNSKYIIYGNLNMVPAELLEEYKAISIKSLVMRRASEADITKEDVYIYMRLLKAKEVNIQNNTYMRIFTGNRGASFYLQYLNKDQTWELYINEEINLSRTIKMKLKKYFSVFSDIYPNVHKILLMFLCYAVPNSIVRQGISNIRNVLDLIRQDRLTMGISDPVLEYHKANKVGCLEIYENSLFLSFSKGSREVIPEVSKKYRQYFCRSVLIDKGGKYIIVDPPAELALVPKIGVTEYYIKKKYKDLLEVIEKEFGGHIDQLTLGSCISKYPHFNKYLEEIHKDLSNKVKGGIYDLFDVFVEVSGMQTDKAAKYSARFGLVTSVPTASTLSTKEDLIDIRRNNVSSYFDKILKKEKELRGK